MNGRRSAPPMKKSEKFPKVKLWSIFTTSLELILSEIPKKASARPARRGGQKNPSAAAAAARKKGLGKRNRRSRLYEKRRRRTKFVMCFIIK